MADNETRYRKTPEAAKRVNLSPSTMAKYRVYGGGPRYRKFGRSVRYTDEDLDEWADARARTHTSDEGA